MGYSSLTVFFEDPFWVGVYERTDGGRYEAKDYEVWDFLLKNWGRLRFSPSLPAREPAERKINPKRMQRTIHSQLQSSGVGTKAQQALQLQREQRKQERKTVSREQREAEKERRYTLRQQKRREKHRGR